MFVIFFAATTLQIDLFHNSLKGIINNWKSFLASQCWLAQISKIRVGSRVNMDLEIFKEKPEVTVIQP